MVVLRAKCLFKILSRFARIIRQPKQNGCISKGIILTLQMNATQVEISFFFIPTDKELSLTKL